MRIVTGRRLLGSASESAIVVADPASARPLVRAHRSRRRTRPHPRPAPRPCPSSRYRRMRHAVVSTPPCLACSRRRRVVFGAQLVRGVPRLVTAAPLAAPSVAVKPGRVHAWLRLHAPPLGLASATICRCRCSRLPRQCCCSLSPPPRRAAASWLRPQQPCTTEPLATTASGLLDSTSATSSSRLRCCQRAAGQRASAPRRRCSTCMHAAWSHRPP